MTIEGKREVVEALLNNYDISSVKDIEDALKDLLANTLKEMMESEMDEHIGYEKNKQDDNRDNYRNGYRSKKVRSSYGEFDIEVPQDRNSTRDISETIEEMYGFDVDATVFSVRHEGKVSKKAAYVIMGIDKEGYKDVLVFCSDRLTGIKEAIEAV